MTQETSSNKPFIKQGVDPVRWLGWLETDIDVTVRLVYHMHPDISMFNPTDETGGKHIL